MTNQDAKSDLLAAEGRTHVIGRLLETAGNLVGDQWARNPDSRNHSRRPCKPTDPDAIAWSAQGAIAYASHGWRAARRHWEAADKTRDTGPIFIDALPPGAEETETTAAFAADIGKADGPDPVEAIRQWNRKQPHGMAVRYALTTLSVRYLTEAAEIRKRRLKRDPS